MCVPGEVGAAYVADEEGVAGEDGAGLRGFGEVGEDGADAFDRVAGGVEEVESGVAELSESPSWIAMWGNVAWACSPTWMRAPVRSANSRWPETKSAWRWVSMMCSMRRFFARAHSR